MKSLQVSCLGLLASTVLFAAPPQKYSYWVEPCARPEQACLANDPQLAEWSFAAWQNASQGALEFHRVQEARGARIRVFWASAEQGLYGETRTVLVDGKPAADVYILPAPFPNNSDPLLRDVIVYLTCLHETGHALGLGHTAVFEDIMYSFQYGGDFAEYFGRYRRKLQSRDDIRKNAGMSDADRKHLAAVLAQ